MTDVNQIIGDISKDKQSIKEEIGYRDNVIPVFKVDEGITSSPNDLNIYHGPVTVKERDISADTIWGNFNWGEKNWDGSYNNPLVIYRIINGGNIFREYFRTTTFIDTDNTTATVDTTNNRVVF